MSAQEHIPENNALQSMIFSRVKPLSERAHCDDCQKSQLINYELSLHGLLPAFTISKEELYLNCVLSAEMFFYKTTFPLESVLSTVFQRII